MKKIVKYFGIFLSLALMGTACNIQEENGSADIGLGIKVFFPTKVVAGQPMTINGSDFSAVKEIVFPDGVGVSDFELVSNEMIRVTAPSGIAAGGGKLIVRTSGEQAESTQTLTLGNTVVTGFSKQEGEEIQGGEQLTIFGTDLEFINGVKLLDPDGVEYILDEKDFYRKGTSSVIISIPKKNILDGTFVGTLLTYDGKQIPLPELTYKPAADEGHWETQKVIIWENDDPDGHGAVSWNGTYRFALEGHDGNNECIAEIPQDIWNRMMSETFYLDVQATDPQIRITNGWWDTQWLSDFQPGNERLTDNGDGTWTLELNLSDAADFVATLEEKHLLLTGDRFTPLRIYFTEDVWVGGEGHMEIVKTSIWKGDGTSGAVSWNGTYRFALEGHDGNNECIAEIPQDIWNRMMSETFYLDVQATDPQIRITNGWWDTQWLSDFQPGNERLTDNGDGTWTLEINFSDAADFVATLEEKHLLFTGDRFTPMEIYFAEEIWVGGGGDAGNGEIDIAPFTLYEDRSANLTYPYYPSWGDNSGKLRIMRGLGDAPIETLGLTTSSKFIIYKEAGTTGQIQFNNPNWADFQAGCNDWDGSAETIEVPITEDMLKCINGEVTDGWSDTAIILQGDGLTVTKIVIVK